MILAQIQEVREFLSACGMYVKYVHQVSYEVNNEQLNKNKAFGHVKAVFLSNLQSLIKQVLCHQTLKTHLEFVCYNSILNPRGQWHRSPCSEDPDIKKQKEISTLH